MAWEDWKLAYTAWIAAERGGPLGAVARALLTGMAAGYGSAISLRRHLYEAGLLRRVRLPGPVVSVGNLTLGGTGKTPMVEWLARWFLARDRTVAVLSRGYGRVTGAATVPGAGADAAAADDEAPTDLAAPPGRFLRLLGADRAASGARAFAEHGADVALLDDGFQHLRLERDLDLLLVEALAPRGSDRLFPRGLLREPERALARADVIVLTRADLVDEATRARRLERLAALAAGRAPVLTAAHRPVALRALDGSAAGAPEELSGVPVFSACGLGNPAGFRGALERLGARWVGGRAFADHHAYTAADARAVDEEARRAGAALVLMTEKDRVKLRRLAPAPGAPAPTVPVRSLVVRLAILEGEAALTGRLEPLLGAPRAAVAADGIASARPAEAPDLAAGLRVG